jgi:hypothetical protein
MSDLLVKTLSVPDWFKDRVRLMVFKSNDSDHYYIASTHKSTREMEDDPVVKDFIKDKRYSHVPMQFVVNDCESMEYAYVCINADCAFPPSYIVFADNESDALGWFLSETNACLVEEPDLKDYDQESLSYDDNGRPMDTESLHIIQLKPIMIVFA